MSIVAAAIFGWPDQGRAVEVSPLNADPLVLPAGHGRILHFDGAVESVFIADPAIADVRVVAPDVVYAFGKRIGSTNLIAVSTEDKRRITMEIMVSTDEQTPNTSQRQLHPTSTIEISVLGNRVAATGRARTLEDATGAADVAQTYSPPGQPPINETTLEGSQQVNIRVRFVEVSRNELRALGFDWKLLGGAGTSFGFPGTLKIDVLIEALQRAGALTILAEPNLTAITGQSASFLAGGEIPVPHPVARGEPPSFDYKQFGVSLEFTPTVIRTNRIALRVKPSVSALSEFGAVKIGDTSIPSFTVRRADTTVEVASGQTFAVAGLFQRQLSKDVDKLPLLGEIPVLGALFTSERYRRDETELVILVTTYLVQPTRDRLAATPMDRPSQMAAARRPVASLATFGPPPLQSGYFVK
jgi:pilus assembly protein CpaC